MISSEQANIHLFRERRPDGSHTPLQPVDVMPAWQSISLRPTKYVIGSADAAWTLLAAHPLEQLVISGPPDDDGRQRFSLGGAGAFDLCAVEDEFRSRMRKSV